MFQQHFSQQQGFQIPFNAGYKQQSPPLHKLKPSLNPNSIKQIEQILQIIQKSQSIKDKNLIETFEKFIQLKELAISNVDVKQKTIIENNNNDVIQLVQKKNDKKSQNKKKNKQNFNEQTQNNKIYQQMIYLALKSIHQWNIQQIHNIIHHKFTCPNILSAVPTIIFTKLTFLDLSNNKITNIQSLQFMNCFDTLKILNLNENLIVQLKSLHKSSWKQLKQIDLVSNRFSRDTLKTLGRINFKNKHFSQIKYSQLYNVLEVDTILAKTNMQKITAISISPVTILPQKTYLPSSISYKPFQSILKYSTFQIIKKYQLSIDIKHFDQQLDEQKRMFIKNYFIQNYHNNQDYNIWACLKTRSQFIWKLKTSFQRRFYQKLCPVSEQQNQFFYHIARNVNTIFHEQFQQSPLNKNNNFSQNPVKRFLTQKDLNFPPYQKLLIQLWNQKNYFNVWKNNIKAWDPYFWMGI